MLARGLEQSKKSSIHKTFSAYKDQKAAYRFLANPKVKESYFIESMKRECSLACKGKSVLAYCDTSTINTNAKVGRISDFEGLGVVSRNQNKETIGFFTHPIMIEDEKDGTPYGISTVKLYNRSLERSTFDKSKKDVLRSIPIEEKESYKWIKPCIETRDEVLKKAERVTFVMDREGDIIEVFDRIPNSNTEVVVRSMHNRKIINKAGKKLRLREQLSNQKASSCYKLKLNKRGEQGKRKSIVVEVKWGNIQLLAPRGHQLKSPISASYVEVKQVQEGSKKIKNPIHWILLTSKEVRTTQEALEIVVIYKRRWTIEVFFKLLKSDGFNIEKTELETGKVIRKLTLIIMQVSIKLLQLKAARTGETDLTTNMIFTELEVECLKKLNEKLEGNTIKQQNPYDPDHLSWASWIIARLGGWTEFYNKARPPGNKAFIAGLEKFDAIIVGFNLIA